MNKKMNTTLSVLLLTLWIAGCREIKTTTTVYEDGRIERKIAIEGNSNKLQESAFPFPIDSTWSRQRTHQAQDSTKTVTTWSRQFSGIAELQACYKAITHPALRVKVDIKSERKFRWFYTYWQYSETYHAYNVHILKPVSDYLSADELLFWINKPDSSDEVEKKMDQWMMDNMFAEFYQTLQHQVRRLNDPRLDIQLLDAHKSELYHALMDSSSEADEVDEILAVCQQIYGSDVLNAARVAIDSSLISLEKHLEFETDLSLNSYTNTVLLPGQLWASNGQIVEQGQVTWNLTSRNFQFEDFSMWARSRKANIGLTILSAIMAILLAAGLIIAHIKSRNVNP